MSRIDEVDRHAQRAAEQRAIEKQNEQYRVQARRSDERRFAPLIRSSEPAAHVLWQVSPADRRERALSSSEARTARQESLANPQAREARACVDGAPAKDATAQSQSGPTTERAANAPPPEGTAVQSEPDVRADADGPGDGGSSSGSDDGEHLPKDSAAAFRFSPALLAPIPVAKKNETRPSERLRALAAEIAQRIVERVYIGTNGAGRPEFQIDLRSNVLKGLSITISSTRGIIRASFTGTDREVLRLLRSHSEGLSVALGSRGLVLGELRIEERP